MSGASHVAIAGVAENQDQEKINPAGEPTGTAKPDTRDQAADEEQPTVDAGNPKKVPGHANADDGKEEVKTEGTFLGCDGHDWAMIGIGVAAGATIVGGTWALCSALSGD